MAVDGDRIDRWGGKSDTPARTGPWKILREGPKTKMAAVIAPPRPPRRPPEQKQLRPSAALDSVGPKIETPNKLTAKGAVVALAGRVSDASRVIEISVDSRPVTLNADGSFSVRRGVPQGNSEIIIVATDEWGNSATRRVAVTRRAVVASVAARKTKKPMTMLGALADIHYGGYHALVIGNNKYGDLPALKTAVNDARAVAEILTNEYGFKVTKLINATRSDIIRGLSRMRAKLKPDDNLLIYYAGHGILDDIAEQGYWLPVDAEKDVPTNWVSVGDLTVMLRAIRAKHVMVVADSCYSGTLVRAAAVKIKTAKARAAWVKRMAKKRSRTALVSGGLEPMLDGGGGGDNSHSVFAKSFLAALTENRSVIEGQALFDAIKRPVVLNADQTPQYSDIRRAGHEGGDFLFVRR